MAIYIPHRFLNRLTSTEGMDRVNVMIIGTFNPGLPDLEQLEAHEFAAFEAIRATSKFAKFNEVMNFYDRPQNRFWKVMDHVNTPGFYADGNFKRKNIEGLKFFQQMRERQLVFERQQLFCRSRGILITDIARAIRPASFESIYQNFPDTAVEKGDPVWNDEAIRRVIFNYQPKKIIVNFKFDNPGIPQIANKIRELQEITKPGIFI
jgi:hypothetical protein